MGLFHISLRGRSVRHTTPSAMSRSWATAREIQMRRFRKGHRAYSSINPVISSAVKQMRMAAGPWVFFDFFSSGAG